MADKNKLNEDLQHFEALGAKDQELIQKLNEFMILLENSQIDSKNIRGIRNTVNKAFDQKISSKEVIREIKEVSLSGLTKTEQLDQLESILNKNYLDSKQTTQISYKKGLFKILKVIIGFLFVTLGFSMIVMPAPPYFEMFTIFYFSPNDGFTLMDLISLIIIAVGIYIILGAAVNYKTNE